MSISDLLKSLYDNLVLAVTTCNEFTEALPDCYDAVEAKGGTLPQEQTAGNLASAIATIPSGGGGISLAGYNYSDPSSIEGIGQAIWAWDKGKEVTEIVDNYTSMNIDNSTGLYDNWAANNNATSRMLIFPNLTKLTFTKSGVLDNRGINRFFLRYIPVEELSIPFTDVIMNDSGAAPKFRDRYNIERDVHMWGAKICAACALAWCFIVCWNIWYVPLAAIAIPAIAATATKSWKKCYTYWLEMMAFVATFATIITEACIL